MIMASAPSTPKAGWEVKTLGEVCRIELGKTPARNNSSYWDKERQTDNVWLSIADLPQRNLAVVDDSKEYISEEGSKLCKIVPEGTLMVSFKLTLGRLAYAGKDLYTNEAIASLYVQDDTLFAKHYLYYYLTFFDWDKAAEGDVKIKGKTLNKKKLKELKIIVPPLAEQERIVGILDEAFEGIAAATAQAEKNLHNARELFQSVLQSTFSQKGDDWVETTLEEVCGFQNGFAFKSAKFRESGMPILRISNIQDDQIDTRKIVFTDPNDYREDLDRYRVVKDDLLIAMSGATTGKIGFNTTDTIFLLNQRVGKFEPSGSLEKRFLYFYLLTKVEENLRISAGAAQPNLSTEQIKGFQIPLPQVPQQQAIVEKLDALSEETKALEAIYERKQSALAELKQSLLQKAFAGEL